MRISYVTKSIVSNSSNVLGIFKTSYSWTLEITDFQLGIWCDYVSLLNIYFTLLFVSMHICVLRMYSALRSQMWASPRVAKPGPILHFCVGTIKLEPF